jgi:hypothetical protein
MSEIMFNEEMRRALELDGEKLRQMTGEDHGPYFLTDEAACACGEKNIDQCMCSCDGVHKGVRELLNSASGILEVHGISIPLPWDGTLDDLEQDRFRGLLAVVNFVREEEGKHSAKMREVLQSIADLEGEDLRDLAMLDAKATIIERLADRARSAILPTPPTA